MAQFQYKGKGFLQTTGRNMSNHTGIFAQSLNTVTLNSAQQNTGVVSGAGLSPHQLQAISINSLGGNATSVTDWLSHITDKNPNVKKYEVIESTEDIIACAVAAHRFMKEKGIYYKLLDSGLFQNITQEDRTKAQDIKDYYSKKIMMWKLKGNGSLSPFRESMNKLIHSDCLTFKENMIGVAYWLPEFYQYDTELDGVKIAVDTNQNFKQLDKEGKPHSLRLSVELNNLQKINHVTKRSKNTEYWFKDDKMNAAVVLSVEHKNQLQHLWDHIFDTEKVLKIEGQYYRRKLDDFEYYSVINWKIDRT